MIGQRYRVWDKAKDEWADKFEFGTIIGAQEHKLDLAQKAIDAGRFGKYTKAYANLETKNADAE